MCVAKVYILYMLNTSLTNPSAESQRESESIKNHRKMLSMEIYEIDMLDNIKMWENCTNKQTLISNGCRKKKMKKIVYFIYFTVAHGKEWRGKKNFAALSKRLWMYTI